MATIEISVQQDTTYNVTLKVNDEHKEIIGYQLKTLREATKLAESYKQLDNSISISILTYAKENTNPYKEMGSIAESIGLPSNSFDGIVDMLMEYRKSKDAGNTKKEFVNMFFESNKIIN